MTEFILTEDEIVELHAFSCRVSLPLLTVKRALESHETLRKERDAALARTVKLESVLQEIVRAFRPSDAHDPNCATIEWSAEAICDCSRFSRLEVRDSWDALLEKAEMKREEGT